jgi:hypothetical protein
VISLSPHIAELGPLTVIATIGDAQARVGRATAGMRDMLPVAPATGSGCGGRIRQVLRSAVTQLPDYQSKTCIVFPGPELVFLEALADLSYTGRVLMVLDGVLDNPTVERIQCNVPKGLDVSVHQLPYVPDRLGVTGTVLAVPGFECGSGYALVTKVAVRTLGLCRSFYFGDIAFLDGIGERVYGRPVTENWALISKRNAFNC